MAQRENDDITENNGCHKWPSKSSLISRKSVDTYVRYHSAFSNSKAYKFGAKLNILTARKHRIWITRPHPPFDHARLLHGNANAWSLRSL